MENEKLEQLDAQLSKDLATVNGKARLDALFINAMIGRMRYTQRPHGDHHKARALRAKARIAKRKAKRKG